MRYSSSVVGAVALLSSTSTTTALPVCQDVSPKLSCGISYTNEATCSAAGCCWDATTTSTATSTTTATTTATTPSCFAPAVSGYTYTELQNTPGIRSGTLTLTQESGIFGGGDFTTLDMTVTQETTARTHIKIVPPESTQWEIPESLLPRPGGLYEGTDALTSVQITDDATKPMEIVITRADQNSETEENIFLFSKDMVYQEQYLQYVLDVPSGRCTALSCRHGIDVVTLNEFPYVLCFIVLVYRYCYNFWFWGVYTCHTTHGYRKHQHFVEF